MPLRDHFRSPINDHHRWNELHGGWPMMLVRHLYDILPAGYVAAPNVHIGQLFEIDVTAFEAPGQYGAGVATGDGDGGVAIAAPPEPTLTLETDLSDQDEFEVLIYDTEQGRQLVAAIEIVSPANKDRPENRRAFVAKIAALLQKNICVSVVDLVTIRQFNLYADLLELIGSVDPKLGPTPPHLYSFTIRSRKRAANKKRTSGNERSLLDLWYYPMTLGQPLPTLPIWLKSAVSILLPLEASYQETCRLLHVE
jgi:hypothetical protein